MKKWITKNGSVIYQVLGERSNSFLISAKQKNILVDTGTQSSYKRLLQNIKSVKSDNEIIDILILTHTHYDHCQNAFMIKKDFNSRIIMNESESAFVLKGYTPLPNGTFGITKFISFVGKKLGKRYFGYTPFSADTILKESYDLTDNGLDIKLISTKGHSIGSISVIVDNEIALVGDTMFGKFKQSVFPPFADDIDQMIMSWEKLLRTNCITFLPGHGKEINRELVQKELERHRLKRKQN
jgi:glyoxylase-like metal-dependent hydrolase (beta-lactamase superfamily II)